MLVMPQLGSYSCMHPLNMHLTDDSVNKAASHRGNANSCRAIKSATHLALAELKRRGGVEGVGVVEVYRCRSRCSSNEGLPASLRGLRLGCGLGGPGPVGGGLTSLRASKRRAKAGAQVRWPSPLTTASGARRRFRALGLSGGGAFLASALRALINFS